MQLPEIKLFRDLLKEKGLYKLAQLINSFAFQNGYTFICYKLPGSSLATFIISSTNQPLADLVLESIQNSYLVCPFYNTAADAQLFSCDVLLTIDSTTEELVEESSSCTEHFATQIQYFASENIIDSAAGYYYLDDTTNQTNQLEFQKGVALAVEEVKKGKLEKVVLSRVKKTPKTENFDPLKAWFLLTETYPLAFVNLLSSPLFGTWLTATPEILMEIDPDKCFKTVALAGTKPYTTEPKENEVAWSQKEIEEQALVSRYIVNCFKSIRLRQFEEKGPKTVTAGPLRHLQTVFTIDLLKQEVEKAATKLLHLLHPTSAVAGMPKENALQFIHNHESYNRLLYSGFCGPVGINSATNLFVQLRCVQVLKNNLLFYAGAGITEDSDPEKEWQETEIKTQVLAQVLTSTMLQN